MTTKKLNALMASMLSAGALLLTAPVVSNAVAGSEWDTHKVGAGQSIPTKGMAYKGTFLPSGMGWDAFSVGDGQRITAAKDQPYRGTSLKAAPSGDSDLFKVNAY